MDAGLQTTWVVISCQPLVAENNFFLHSVLVFSDFALPAARVYRRCFIDIAVSNSPQIEKLSICLHHS